MILPKNGSGGRVTAAIGQARFREGSMVRVLSSTGSNLSFAAVAHKTRTIIAWIDAEQSSWTLEKPSGKGKSAQGNASDIAHQRRNVGVSEESRAKALRWRCEFGTGKVVGVKRQNVTLQASSSSSTTAAATHRREDEVYIMKVGVHESLRARGGDANYKCIKVKIRRLELFLCTLFSSKMTRIWK